MWILVVTIGYLLNGASSVINKSLLNKDIPNPVVYTFYITALGLFVFVLAPFGFSWIGLNMFLVSALAGILFTLGLLYMFIALVKDEVSRVTPLIGGLQPIFVFALAFFLLDERLLFNQILAFALILIGGILITIQSGKSTKSQAKMFWLSVLSSFLFAASFVLTKFVFNNVDFISGFIWIRIGSFIAASIFLLSKKQRQAIFYNTGNAKQGVTLAFILGQGAGALSFIMINWAISMGSVTLVNALQGLQYVFLFVIVFVLAKKYPQLLDEDLHKKVVIQKIIAILLIAVGMYFIV
ncbi:MAG: hypothetical protein ACKKL6_01320 [Candidatus Komeilibacteria bacterium]